MEKVLSWKDSTTQGDGITVYFNTSNYSDIHMTGLN